MPEIEVGHVVGYFAKIGVAAVELTGTLRLGDTIRVRGHTTDFTQVVESMQIEHQAVSEAKAGDSVGIKVIDRVRKGDRVYVVTE